MQAQFTAEYYRALFDALDQGFCIIQVLFDQDQHPYDLRFVDVNAAFEQETGLHDAVGRRIRELAPALEEDWFRIYGDVALGGTPVRFEHEAAALGRWYDVYAFRVGEPRLRHVAVLFTDITRRRKAEETVQSAIREAERANRAKDEFLAMLGHELRNPLAPMVTALQLMRLRGMDSREQEVLERQVKYLTRMVDDLLDVSRIARGKIELKRRPIELCQVVLNAIEIAGPLIEQRQHFVDVQVPTHGASIDVDPARMAQVLSNLLTNAAKYSAPGSRIVVAGGRDGDTVTVSVKDEGAGLAPEMLDTVFEPFIQQGQSLDRAGGGLGLGLAIVRNLVTAHGGTVRVESGGPGRGSEFTITLAAGRELTERETGVPPAPAPATAAHPGRTRILVVDDNQDAALMLREALEQLGYLVEVAFDGPSALARAARFQPGAVLLDIGLPLMDGYEVARRLRAAPDGESICLVAVTGYGQDADREHARDAGFHHHLVKPIDLDRLHALLQEPAPIELR